MAELKGVLLNSWMKYLQKRFSEQQVSAHIELLSPGDRHLFSTKFLDATWYPLETFGALRRLVRSLAPRIDPEMLIELGRFTAENAYTGVYRSLVANDPSKTVERFAWAEDLFFRGFRKLESQLTGPASCVLRYKYDGGFKPTRGMCTSLIGFWSQLLEMSGASGVEGSHQVCQAAGADKCEFEFNWSKAAAKGK
ncbi:MAG TPA: hypothetical protein VJX67_05260 [Blastocatellia bacterium]|nr:hypothetical protein [Blastocatellia bacterium]